VPPPLAASCLTRPSIHAAFEPCHFENLFSPLWPVLPAHQRHDTLPPLASHAQLQSCRSRCHHPCSLGYTSFGILVHVDINSALFGFLNKKIFLAVSLVTSTILVGSGCSRPFRPTPPCWAKSSITKSFPLLTVPYLRPLVFGRPTRPPKPRLRSFLWRPLCLCLSAAFCLSRLFQTGRATTCYPTATFVCFSQAGPALCLLPAYWFAFPSSFLLDSNLQKASILTKLLTTEVFPHTHLLSLVGDFFSIEGECQGTSTSSTLASVTVRCLRGHYSHDDPLHKVD
jgi:hypothetical protein